MELNPNFSSQLSPLVGEATQPPLGSGQLWATPWDGRDPELRCLVPTFGGGGSERVCLRLCNAWAQAGHRVEAVIFGVHESEFLPFVDRRVRVFSLGVQRARHALRPLARHVGAAPNVPLLVFGFTQAMITGWARFTRMMSCPLIYREGSLPKVNVPRSRWWLYGLVLNRCDAIVAQSQCASGQLAELGVWRPRRYVIGNPLPPEAWSTPSVKHAGDTQAPRLLAIGRLSPEKGFIRLLEAFAHCRRTHPGARLTIVGEGAQREALMARASALGLGDSVALPGFSHEVIARLAETDVFVSSSVYEGQPNALMEALAAGCRVVTVDSGGGTRELMEQCGLGDFIVAPHDFTERLGVVVARALESSDSLWAAARFELRRFTDIELVQRTYFAACMASRGVET